MDELCCDRRGGGDQVYVSDRDWDGWEEETEGIANRAALLFVRFNSILSSIGCSRKTSVWTEASDLLMSFEIARGHHDTQEVPPPMVN